MLSQTSINIIKATVPAVAAHAEAITNHFYPLMFEQFPQVKGLFNQTHQQQGAQPKALATALVAYAANIENLAVLTPTIERIVNKHVSLNIQAEHYKIVGTCLLQAIKTVLGKAATESVMAAWTEAYWQLADLLIKAEEARYYAMEQQHGGWRGERRFNVVRKQAESDVITSFYLEPSDGSAVPEYKAGQYIGVVMMIDGQETRRNYSVSCAPGKEYLRISVKREPQGLVSNYLHDNICIGDSLLLLPPAGDFVLSDSDKPLVLLTAGVGVTPAVSMLDHCIYSGRTIHFIHAALNASVHAFRRHIDALADQYKNLKLCYCYSNPLPGDQSHATGVVTKALLKEQLGGKSNVDFYLLGPKMFMVSMYQIAIDLGVSKQNIYYEFFGPMEDIICVGKDAVV